MTELDVLRSKIRERMNDIADALATGACRTYEQYQHMCGVIEGLAHSERDILDMQDQQERLNG